MKRMIAAIALALGMVGPTPALAATPSPNSPGALTCVTVYPVWVLDHQVTWTITVCIPTP
jgi:hypothetical protein